MDSPPPSSPQPEHASTISPETFAAAAERRSQGQPTQISAAQLVQEHERKQKFRRMIDPGIVRPNPKEQALSSLKTLAKIAENLLNEPENHKYQRFKPTNTIIKRELVDRKGVLEYAIELGFRPEVENFQPYYGWHPRHLEDLRVGTEILKEHLAISKQKEERASVSKLSEKEIREAAAEKASISFVRLAFMDDRKARMQRDEMEKQARDARASAVRADGPARIRISRSRSRESTMPGHGEALSAPPPYEAPPAESE